MSYKSRYGDTNITYRFSRKHPRRFGVLDISWDYDKDPKNKKERFPVFLWTPDMEDTINHDHIALTKAQARKLRDWLTAYLKEAL